MEVDNGNSKMAGRTSFFSPFTVGCYNPNRLLQDGCLSPMCIFYNGWVGGRIMSRAAGGLPSKHLFQMLLKPLLLTSCWPNLSHMLLPSSKGNWEMPHSFIHSEWPRRRNEYQGIRSFVLRVSGKIFAQIES